MTALVAIAENPNSSAADLLADALERCGFAAVLTEASDGRDLDDLAVIVVPELGGFERGSPAAADPLLVETLVDHLHDLGCTEVVVGAGADSSQLWAGNRDAYALADLLGYGYVTPAGRDYDIVDLADDLVDGGFARGDVLAGSPLARAWRDADVRIVVAANRTDPADGYHLALGTTLRALPATDDHYHYRLGAQPAVVVEELLRVTPVHLAIIDAVVSAHGSGGASAPLPVDTHTVIGGRDVRLVDTVGALRMGLDPGVSPLYGDEQPMLGLGAVDGSMGVYDGFTAPAPSLLHATRARDEDPTIARLVVPWLQTLDVEAFPLQSPLDVRVNERLAGLAGRVDDDPLALAALVTANSVLAGLGRSLANYRVLFDKDAVRRRRVPLGFDPATVDEATWERLLPDLLGLEALLAGTREAAPGLRWRTIAGATVFVYDRVVHVPFDEFVAAVDVSRTISYMNDYLGGVVVPLAHHEDGSVVRQAERNLYLPQPNYLAVWGGEPIDVGKVEVVEVTRDRHLMAWQTVVSENGSAVHDDGVVTFEPDADTAGGTRVRIVGRQQFVLPPALAALDMSLFPQLEHQLVTHAYSTFFDRTLANLEALVEGRDIRIGRAWTSLSEPTASEPLPALALERLLEDAVDWADVVTSRLRGPTPAARRGGATPARVDADGFAHFPGPGAGGTSAATALAAAPPSSPLADAAGEWWAGLAGAWWRDWMHLWPGGRS